MASLITLANALSLLVLFFNGPAAHAQNTAYPRAEAQPAMQAASPQAPVPATPTSTYNSAFEGYRPFSAGEVGDWRKANETVREIGGWRAYARESQQGAKAQPAPPPQSSTGQPPAGATHQGHGK